MPLKTVIIVSQSKSDTLEQLNAGVTGYQVQLEVTVASNIDPKIFIMRREVLSLGVQSEEDESPYEDTFFSVASPAYMESIPEVPTSDCPFYRLSSIALVFESLEEMERGLAAIMQLIESLRLANDRVINLVENETLVFPPEALARFWGLSAETTITDEILLAGPSDAGMSIIFEKVVPNGSGPRYLYFAHPESFGEISTVRINNNIVACTSATRNVVTIGTLAVSYIVYRTTATLTGNSFILETA